MTYGKADLVSLGLGDEEAAEIAADDSCQLILHSMGAQKGISFLREVMLQRQALLRELAALGDCAETRYRRRKRRSSLLSLTPLANDPWPWMLKVWDGRCALCGVRLRPAVPVTPESRSIEHAVALSRGGAHEVGNVYPSCRSCNSKKHSKPLAEWYKAQPFFAEARWRKILRYCPGAANDQLPLTFPLDPPGQAA